MSPAPEPAAGEAAGRAGETVVIETAPAPDEPGAALVNAGCVAARSEDGWAAALILGPSGVGKSGLALRLIALGARLVSDDWTLLRRAEPGGGRGGLIASAPPALSGLIEARGVGLLRLTPLDSAPLRWAAMLERSGEGLAERLPPVRRAALLGETVPFLRLSDDDHMAAALFCLLRGGALLDPEAGLAERRGES